MTSEGHIAEWSQERGFGFLECDGKRVFLHWRDFKERYRQPKIGDVVTFTMGSDKQGRPCAKAAVQSRETDFARGRHSSAPSRLKGWHLVVIAGLLILPAVALYRAYGQKIALYSAAWCAAVSWLTYGLYSSDKQLAKTKARRISEGTLHFFEMLGGWPGAFLAQRRLRHKSSKESYLFGFVLIVGLHQWIAIDALRGWPFFKLLAKAAEKLGA